MLAMERGAPRDTPGDSAADEHAGPHVRPDIVPFEPWHLHWLTLQPTQAHLKELLTDAHGAAIQKAGPAYTAFVGYEVIACAGIIQMWPGRAQVWSLLSDKMPDYARDIHRAVRNYLRAYRVRRLECIVDPRHAAAVRWAKHLGFTYESTMEAYDMHGNDQHLFVRLQRG